jgi:hypothetical protein
VSARHHRDPRLGAVLQTQQFLHPGAGEGRHGADDSRLEGGVNRAKLKFTNINTTTSRVSVRSINESAREGAKQIASK